MGILGTLFIVFLVLKLVGVITWGWFAVCSPLLAGLALGIFAAFFKAME